MSLVNEMLRDLDSRSSVREPELEGLQPVQLPELERGWGKLALLAGALTLIALSAIGYRTLFAPELDLASAVKRPFQMPDRPALATAAVANEPAEPITASIPHQETPQQLGQPAAQHQVTQPQHALVDQHVQPGDSAGAALSGLEPLLAAAEQALAEDRLTQPPVYNAHALYRHALLLDPANAQALSGIERIYGRYEDLVYAAIAAADWDLAERYLQRVELVSMPEGRLQRLQLAVSRAKHDAGQRRIAETSTSVAAEVTVSASLPEQKSALNADTARLGSADESHTRIAPSWRSQQTALIKQAEQLVNAGQTEEAIGRLKAFVNTYNQAEAAALRLFDLHLEQGATAAAESMAGSINNEPLSRYFEARLLTHKNHDAEALQLLESASPTGPVRQPWLALLAALYQRNGQAAQAVTHYQQLLDIDNRNPSYWLGLGVAAEAAGQPQLALKAFVAANNLPAGNAAVTDYIKQRIQALSR